LPRASVIYYTKKYVESADPKTNNVLISVRQEDWFRSGDGWRPPAPSKMVAKKVRKKSWFPVPRHRPPLGMRHRRAPTPSNPSPTQTEQWSNAKCAHPSGFIKFHTYIHPHQYVLINMRVGIINISIAIYRRLNLRNICCERDILHNHAASCDCFIKVWLLRYLMLIFER
jgi:hypothetical protein